MTMSLEVPTPSQLNGISRAPNGDTTDSVSSPKRIKKVKSSKTDSEFSIVCGEENYVVQKQILLENSAYFMALIEGSTHMKESRTNKVDLSSINRDALHLAIGFMHTHRIDVNWDNLQSLLDVSTHLQIDLLTTKCCEFMKMAFQYQHLSKILLYAHSYCLTSVEEFVEEYCAHDFLNLIEQRDIFYSLEIQRLTRIVRKDGLRVRSELFLLTHLELYITDGHHRGHIINEEEVELFSCVRFCLMIYEELVLLISRPKSYPQPIITLIQTAIQYHQKFTNGNPVQATLQNQIRSPQPSIVLIMECGMNQSYEIIACQTNNSEGPTFYSLFKDAAHHRLCGVVNLDNFLYIVSLENFGGFDHDSHITFYCFDPRLRNQRSLPGPTAQVMPSAVTSLGKTIYLCGGVSPSNTVFVSTCEIFDTETLTWTSIQDLPRAIHKGAAVGVSGHIYFSGGQSMLALDRVTLDTLYRYSSDENRWTELEKMLTPRRGHSIVSVNNQHLFVCGGLTDTTGSHSSTLAVERYDISTNQWSKVHQLEMLTGTSIGHCLLLPNQQDTLYTLGHNLPHAQENEVWETTINESQEENKGRFAESKVSIKFPLKVNLNEAFATYLNLDFSNQHLQSHKNSYY